MRLALDSTPLEQWERAELRTLLTAAELRDQDNKEAKQQGSSTPGPGGPQMSG